MQHDRQVIDWAIAHHPESETGHREGLDAIEAGFPEVSSHDYQQQQFLASSTGTETGHSSGIKARDGTILTRINTQISTPPPDRDIDLEEADREHGGDHVSARALAVSVEQDARIKQNALLKIRTHDPDAPTQSLGHTQDLHDVIISPVSGSSGLSSPIDLSPSHSELQSSTADGLLTPRSPTGPQNGKAFNSVQAHTQDIDTDQNAEYAQYSTATEPRSRKRMRNTFPEPHAGYTLRTTRARASRDETPDDTATFEPDVQHAQPHVKIKSGFRDITQRDPAAPFWQEVDALDSVGPRATRAQHRAAVPQAKAVVPKPNRTRRRK